LKKIIKLDSATSVSNTGNTETGFPVFGTLNTDTRKILAVLRTYKMGTFVQNYYLLKKIFGNIHLIYFVFTCKLAFILAYLSKTRLKIISIIKAATWHTKTFI
jgi:hypothetical protein